MRKLKVREGREFHPKLRPGGSASPAALSLPLSYLSFLFPLRLLLLPVNVRKREMWVFFGAGRPEGGSLIPRHSINCRPNDHLWRNVGKMNNACDFFFLRVKVVFEPNHSTERSGQRARMCPYFLKSSVRESGGCTNHTGPGAGREGQVRTKAWFLDIPNLCVRGAGRLPP